jgi:uncharacterized protein YlxP (DUF503 family)
VFVGVARLVLSIPGARSLKDRRRVVKSLKDRVRARLPVSLAEVGDLERYQVATLGVAVVSNEAARCSEVLSAAVAMARVARDAVLADVATEVITLAEGGRGIRGGIESALSAANDFPSSFDDDHEDDD